MTLDYPSLNENQGKAALWDKGPLLVLAGPGSGKTKVLTDRIARIIYITPEENFKILGLTFTKKAAGEMKNRIQNKISNIPHASNRTTISNFHSFAQKILQSYGHYVGLKPNFEIIEDIEDRYEILKIATSEFNASGKFDNKSLLNYIEVLMTKQWKLDLGNSFEDEKEQLLYNVYVEYMKLMKGKNVLDFSGLMYNAIDLLENKEIIKKQVQKIYKYICVDEFQDTNLSQYRLLKNLINNDTKNIFVVADGDQLIYEWSGASPNRLKEITSDYTMKIQRLPENYRCPPSIINIANELIQYNPSITPREKLIANKVTANEKDEIRCFYFDKEDKELLWVANDIASRGKDGHSNCTVIARAKWLLEAVIVELKKVGVSAHLANVKDEFKSAPLLWLRSVLHLADAKSEPRHLRAMCRKFYLLEGININPDDVISNDDFLKAWYNLVLDRAGLNPATKKLINNLPELSDYNSFIFDAFDWFDIIKEQLPNDSEGAFDEYEDEKEILKTLLYDRKGEGQEDILTLQALLQVFEKPFTKKRTSEENSVACYTIHTAKGLEFKNVYIIGMSEGQLPDFRAKDERTIQEERRNCFVAITRTEESLTMTYSKMNNRGYEQEPSRFLKEMKFV